MNNLELLKDSSAILKDIVSTILQTKDNNFIKDLIIKFGAGTVTTTGAFSLASIFGTASTGTAIGTLSGGALTNATLAWIGGSIFTGTIVLASGAIVTGYIATKFYNGKIRHIEDLEEYEKEIVTASLTIVKIVEEESKLNNTVDTEQLYLLFVTAIHPLLMQIYANTDTISSNLNTKYKLAWNSNRVKLLQNIDEIKAVVKAINHS